MAPLLSVSPLVPVGPMVSVAASLRILSSGQSMSCAAPATDCWDVAVEPEKKLEILSLKEGEPDAGGAADVPVAVADGVPRRLPPEQPDASSDRTSHVTIAAQRLLRSPPAAPTR